MKFIKQVAAMDWPGIMVAAGVVVACAAVWWRCWMMNYDPAAEFAAKQAALDAARAAGKVSAAK